MRREKRRKAFAEEHFTMIIVDEANHILSESYQAVLEHFPNARVLGVTATADRGDKRNLGIYFDSLAYEYTLPAAIRDGYLCRIEAQTIPLELDLVAVSLAKGDFKASDLDSALDPYLEKIADEMVNAGCLARKTLVFLPLVKTSQKFAEILRHRRFACAEVNGKSKDRSDILPAFALGNLNVLCNSMLLTEGWDCPSVDCIVVLRPTKIRSLYCQMVGRGTRPHPGKESLLLLDFLWHTDRHELCHPAQLITDSPEVAKKMTEKLADAACPQGLEDLLDEASSDVVRAREASLAKVLEEQRKKKRKLVDPLQFEMSIQAQDLLEYTPEFAWEMLPPTIKQIEMLEKRGIFAETIESQGYANMLIDKLNKRQLDGLSTPRQIRLLEQRGFEHVGSWSFESASALISRIAANGWKVPYDINPKAYAPKPKEQQGFEPWLP